MALGSTGEFVSQTAEKLTFLTISRAPLRKLIGQFIPALRGVFQKKADRPDDTVDVVESSANVLFSIVAPPLHSGRYHCMPQPDIILRTAPKESDIVAVRSIVTSTGVFRSDEIDVAVELIEERLRRGTASGYYFVFAEENGIPVGYTCYGPIACTVASHDLFWIAVDKSLHGRKIGSLLMIETEKLIRVMHGRRVYIETSSRTDYDATRHFYHCHGYIAEAHIRNFYDDNDDKIIYSKELAS